MTNADTIKTRLADAVHCLVIQRSDEFDETKRTQGVSLERLSEELIWLIQQYEEIKINCEGIGDPRNGWRISDLTWWPRYTVNQYFDGNPNEYSYFEDVWLAANSCFDGGEIIAIDLHPSPRFGFIGWVTQTNIDYGGGAIVVAKSFFEWLERTLDHGPHAERPYWREAGFKDYGPLIPDDPCYKPEQ